MNAREIIEALAKKGADRETLAAEVLKDPKVIPALIEQLDAKLFFPLMCNVEYVGARRCHGLEEIWVHRFGILSR